MFVKGGRVTNLSAFSSPFAFNLDLYLPLLFNHISAVIFTVFIIIIITKGIVADIINLLTVFPLFPAALPSSLCCSSSFTMPLV